ncbi:MAG: hypothetical protein KF862_18635 [Chitinophagaceae bacterium]|nr:hypothetical protein [Chitinophagaceae bacterium]
MPDNKDYSKLTLEELIAEEKKIKKDEITSGVITGVAIGIIVYGLVKNGFGLIYTLIPLLLIFMNYRSSQNRKKIRKQIQSEINAKNPK